MICLPGQQWRMANIGRGVACADKQASRRAGAVDVVVWAWPDMDRELHLLLAAANGCTNDAVDVSTVF
jgi:hypothetical protein